MKPFKVVNGVRVDLTDREITLNLQREIELNKMAFECCRKEAYGDVGAQLGMLFDELKEFGTIAKDGKWFQHIQSVKNSHPKGEM